MTVGWISGVTADSEGFTEEVCGLISQLAEKVEMLFAFFPSSSTESLLYNVVEAKAHDSFFSFYPDKSISKIKCVSSVY